MDNILKEIRYFIDFIESNSGEKYYILTESNVMDVYRKLRNNENVSKDEHEQVLKRFEELVNYHH